MLNYACKDYQFVRPSSRSYRDTMDDKAMIYRFGACTLDTQTHELHREGQIVPLQPKVFQVLTYLIAQRHRLVTKQDLLEHVWQSQFVHDSVIARCIMAARKAIGD